MSKPTGRPRKPLILTAYERSEAHNRWAAGCRDGLTRVGEREYQRANQRARRARKDAA